ncbi:MAG TPA: S53 family peptidase [Acidimicrobiia bacterium]|nr:S53 family peptidase [Acidimicrobiia bacterium]
MLGEVKGRLRTARWRRVAGIAIAGGLAVASLAAPDARAGDDGGNRRVRPLNVVTPRATTSPTGLTPAQIKAAYGFPTDYKAGAGETIAVVIPYHHPTIEADLKVFSKTFGLRPCTKVNYCLKQVNHRGSKSNYPATSSLWATEVALDVQWAHAIAPGAKILVVEAKSDRLYDVLKAEDYATSHAGYVSNSLGLNEFSGQSVHNKHFDRPGVSIFVASGDDGTAGGPSYPSTAPGAISVGGTTLVDIGQTTFDEKGWKGSGGGCSRYEKAPAAQAAFDGYAATNCGGKRAAPDVALVGDPRSGVSVYYSYENNDTPWLRLGGTSAATPMWAARAAVSGRVVDAAHLYASPSPIPFRDITAGNNGLPALVGFDLVTGLGSWADDAAPSIPVA